MIKQTKKELEEQLAKEPKLVLNSSHRKSRAKYFGKHFAALPRVEKEQSGRTRPLQRSWMDYWHPGS